MKGILLIQLGTPDEPTTAALRRYLREFLMDARVVDIPAVLRFLLVEGIIVPFRSPKSAHAYRSIWTESGSPLRVATENLAKGVAENFRGKAVVEIGMRYGNPSIESAIEKMDSQGVTEIILAPLYPQYASASTGSSLEEAFRVISKKWALPSVKSLSPFYDRPEFIDAFAAQVDASQLKSCDHFLMSFHGIPERHIAKGDHYRDHCVRTAEALAAKLQIPSEKWTMSFQSRLGVTAWVKPYTDLVIQDLAKKGVENLGVFCPSFVADCLETLEEIGIRAKKDFEVHGGKNLILFPCPNSSPVWVSGLSKLLGDIV